MLHISHETACYLALHIYQFTVNTVSSGGTEFVLCTCCRMLYLQ